MILSKDNKVRRIVKEGHQFRIGGIERILFIYSLSE